MGARNVALGRNSGRAVSKLGGTLRLGKTQALEPGRE
jgi:hypothetical protein